MNGGVLNELALFAGAGGGILAGKLLGWRTVAAVEWEPYAASVLVARQNDGLLPPFPIWDDVQTFDGRPFRGRIDVVSGGFPCQDISVAGKGAGIDGERSGMWKHMARIVGEVRPRFVFVENSPALVTRGLGTVLSDLAALGYDCKWTVLGAADVGAPHKRDRFWLLATDTNRAADGQQYAHACAGNDDDGTLQAMAHAPSSQDNPQWLSCECGWDSLGWNQQTAQRNDRPTSDKCFGRCSCILADANSLRELQPQGCKCHERGRAGNGCSDVAHTNSTRQQEQRRTLANGQEHQAIECGSWWGVEPDVGRMAHGVAARVDRLKAIGNGQVPQCAAAAWRMLGGV